MWALTRVRVLQGAFALGRKPRVCSVRWLASSLSVPDPPIPKALTTIEMSEGFMEVLRNSETKTDVATTLRDYRQRGAHLSATEIAQAHQLLGMLPGEWTEDAAWALDTLRMMLIEGGLSDATAMDWAVFSHTAVLLHTQNAPEVNPGLSFCTLSALVHLVDVGVVQCKDVAPDLIAHLALGFARSKVLSSGLLHDMASSLEMAIENSEGKPDEELHKLGTDLTTTIWSFAVSDLIDANEGIGMITNKLSDPKYEKLAQQLAPEDTIRILWACCITNVPSPALPPALTQRLLNPDTIASLNSFSAAYLMWLAAKNREEVSPREIWNILPDAVSESAVRSFSPSHIGKALWACGHVAVTNTRLISLLVDRLVVICGSTPGFADEQDLSSSACALIRLHVRDPAPYRGLAAMARRSWLPGRADCLFRSPATPLYLTIDLLVALTMSRAVVDEVQHLAASFALTISERIKDESGANLAWTLWVYASLRLAYLPVFVSAAKVVSDPAVQNSLHPRDVATVLWAYPAVSITLAKDCSLALVRRLQEEKALSHLGMQMTANVLWAIAFANISNNNSISILMADMCEHLRGLIERKAVKKEESISIDMLTNAVWALSHSSIESKTLFNAAANMIISDPSFIESARPAEVSFLAWSFAEAECYNQQLFDLFVPHLSFPQMKWMHAVCLMSSMMEMKHPLPTDTVKECCVYVLQSIVHEERTATIATHLPPLACTVSTLLPDAADLMNYLAEIALEVKSNVIKEMTLEGLSQLAWSFSTMLARHEINQVQELFHEIAEVASSHPRIFPDVEDKNEYRLSLSLACNLAWCFSYVNERNKAVAQEGIPFMKTLLDIMTSSDGLFMETVMPRDVAIFLWSLATMIPREAQGAFDIVLEHVRKNPDWIRSLGADHGSILVWAFVMLGCKDSDIMAQIFSHVTRGEVLCRLTPGCAVGLVWSAAQTTAWEDNFWETISAHMLEMEKWKELTTAEADVIVWAYCVAGRASLPLITALTRGQITSGDEVANHRDPMARYAKFHMVYPCNWASHGGKISLKYDSDGMNFALD